MLVAALVVSVLALLTSVAAAWYSRRMSAAADRQAIATEAQAEYARRLLELEERRTAQATHNELVRRLAAQNASLVPPPSPWMLSSAGKNAFRLTNGSPRPVFDVSLTFDVEPTALERREWPRVDERASVKISMFRGMGGVSEAMTVHWRDQPDGELRAWETSLL